MADANQIEKAEGNNWRLTGKNLKFLQFLVKGHKVGEAHRLAGYSGNVQASYALKNKLKHQLGKVFETEGISNDRYLSDLVRLLSLPCVDSHGKPITALKFDQFLAVRKLLREELPEKRQKEPTITAFVIERYRNEETSEQKVKDAKHINVISVPPISGRGKQSD